MLLLAGCGESSEEKAKAQVCTAKSDISKQVKMLSELTISTSLLTQAKDGLEAIAADLTKIKDAQPNLAPARKEQISSATHTFEAQVSRSSPAWSRTRRSATPKSSSRLR